MHRMRISLTLMERCCAAATGSTTTPFTSSAKEAAGFEISLTGVVLHGGTDTAILAEAFALAGIERETWEPKAEAILDTMRETVVGRRGEMQLWTMPAVEETLKHLAGRGALLELGYGQPGADWLDHAGGRGGAARAGFRFWRLQRPF